MTLRLIKISYGSLGKASGAAAVNRIAGRQALVSLLTTSSSKIPFTPSTLRAVDWMYKSSTHHRVRCYVSPVDLPPKLIVAELTSQHELSTS
jgi:hypothetical protein